MREGSVILDCGGRPLDLSHPRVMGILNVTPDSFSDGGRHEDTGRALDHALAMVEAGAAIIDVGGESTRPGAEPVPVEEELARVVPVVEAIAPRVPVPVSVDTSRPEVMARAAAAGAGLINDVRALRLPGALEAARETGLPVCLMHMRTLDPRTMQEDPRYDDVTAEVRAFLEDRVAACESAGIDRRRLLLDPGFGFGKTLEHNLTLFRGLPTLADMGLPLLVGVSRKGMIGALLGDRPVDQRVHGSVAAALMAAQRGAAILRVHDVGPTVDALRILAGLQAPTGH